MPKVSSDVGQKVAQLEQLVSKLKEVESKEKAKNTLLGYANIRWKSIFHPHT